MLENLARQTGVALLDPEVTYLGVDLHRTVKFSVAVASLSCREYGGRMGVPTWEQAIEVAGTLTEMSVASI